MVRLCCYAYHQITAHFKKESFNTLLGLHFTDDQTLIWFACQNKTDIF